MVPAPASADPLIGATLGEYRVLEVIGEGGMGRVYRAVQPLIRKQAAIKVLLLEHAQNPLVVRRLLSEAQAVNTVRHRGIVDIFGFGQVPDGRQYLVMELLEGEGLDAYLKRAGSLSVGEALTVLADVCDPLHAAHAAGVVHRDLKPSNVFMARQADGTRYLKLLDFGLAKDTGLGASHQTSTSTVTGTPDYMAPEQARAKPVTPKTDLYALGCVGFELVTGRPPYVGAAPMDVLMMHVGAPVPSVRELAPEVSESFDVLLRSLMAKDPAQRPASAEAVRVELRRLSRELDDGQTRRTVSPLPRPAAADTDVLAPVRSPRSRWLAAAGAGVALAAALIAWRVSRPAPEPLPPPAVAEPTSAPPEPEHPADPAPTPEPEPEAVEAPAPPAVAEPLPSPARPETPPIARRARVPPTPQALLAYLDALEARLREQSGATGPDPAALKLLDRQRLKASMATDGAGREQVWSALRSWERTFLGAK